MSVPIITGSHIKYITIPIGCKLYDKTQTKLELAAEMIETVANELTEYQVIVLCDAWYTKKSFISRINALSHVELIGAVRVDTAVYVCPLSQVKNEADHVKKVIVSTIENFIIVVRMI